MSAKRMRGRQSVSSNPFMVTSNECYGMSLEKAAKRASFASPVDMSKAPLASNASENSQLNADSSPSYDLSFLYSRESDRFGDGASYSDSALSKVLREKECDSMSKRRRDSVFVKSFCSNDVNKAALSRKAVSKEEVADIVSNYTHKPKDQNPLYSTTANEFGLRKPSEATYTTARHGLSQKFSQSFNRTMYRDEGLNASLTKSRIHDHLNPQFV